MKNQKKIFLTAWLFGLSLLGQAQINTTVSKALVEYIKQNNSAAISASLLKDGTLLPDSIINNGSFKTVKYIPVQNGFHLLFIESITTSHSNYYAMVYNTTYQPTDIKTFLYSCTQCLPTDTITRLWAPDDRTRQDFWIEYYRNTAKHMPLYTVHGIKKEYFRISNTGKITLVTP